MMGGIQVLVLDDGNVHHIEMILSLMLMTIRMNISIQAVVDSRN